jgi:signal transduction histidine kinase
VGTPIPAVIAFATREADRYDDADLEFLTNIAELLSASFGRTVRFAERRRLADIGELASGIAHELRSPLATISLALEHFARLALPANSRRRVVLASGEAARMQRLLDDILLYAKPLRLKLEPVDLVSLTAATLEAARGGRACTAQAIQFSTDQSAAWVLGDQDRLRQILENLLSNACEAAPEQARVDVRLERVDRRWLRLIIDNPGEPPDPELLARIFEPFVSAKPGGTGLGLAIVQRLTTLHGGRVWLEPAGDDRVRAVVQLPLADSKEAPGGAPTPKARGAASLGTGR